MTEGVEELQLSGYSSTIDLLAMSYKAGAYRKYVVGVPLNLLPSLLPKIDPDEKAPGNRQVNKKHALDFGNYWADREDWFAPSILLDTEEPIDFDPKITVGGVQHGVMRLSQFVKLLMQILDGQHRGLGLALKADELRDELIKARAKLSEAKRSGDSLAEKVASDKLEYLRGLEHRLNTEHITVEIVAGMSMAQHKQAFFDVTDNALGINKSVGVEFDSTSVVNRATRILARTHPLLLDRIDFEKDRTSGRNVNLLSARNLADIVRHVLIGISGRWNPRREAAHSEQHVLRIASRYFDALLESFPDLSEVAPDELRSTSLLGSPTILRVLAGAFHDVAVDMTDDLPKIDDEAYELVVAAFQDLAPSMAAPVMPGTDNPWYATGFFPEDGGMAPSSRAQDLTALTRMLGGWVTGDNTKAPFEAVASSAA